MARASLRTNGILRRPTSTIKTARIEPASLARSTFPGRVVDYVVALTPDPATKRAWRSLRLLPGTSIKSWNHTTRAHGKSQTATWTDAWMKRLALIRENSSGSCPALPLLIAQGHDWHSLIVSKTDQTMTNWEQVDIGGTRSCFDAMKVLTILHWLMDWAKRVWQPWLLSLPG
ncbi:hypothetical protein DM02DRAFT_647160 [Periconia macrospinosa]|uniref:PD-(D/E)XK nuclease-like domain-containing protein n=1 Tax=Periconia macrospinosa TaxID=97972 RepID=A0A2V1D3S6_9PLEO|nr:hypothetical protein DM02DRAFT_647160 [Periconia macrospinosa]